MPSKRVIISVAVGFVGVIGFLIWLIFYGLGKYDRELQHEIRLAKEEGVWIYSPDDFLPKVKGANGAAEYMQIEKLLKKVKPLDKAPDFSKPAGLAKARAYLKQMAPALKLAEHACQAPYVLFDGDYNYPLNISIDPLKTMRRIAIGFRYRSRFRDNTTAWKDLDSCIRVGNQATYCPGLIGQLLQVNSSNYLFLEAERLLADDIHQLDTAAKVVQKANQPLNIELGLRVEMYGGYRALLSSSAVSRLAKEEHLLLPPFGGVDQAKTAWQVGIIRLYREALAGVRAAKKPSELIAVGEKLEERLAKDESLEAQVAKMWSPGLGQLMRAFAGNLARQRIMAQVIAILKAPQIPESLPLGGDLAIDPTTDKPLHYTRTKTGFRIYAVGFSGKDLGGVHYRYGLKPKDYDIVFEYPYHPQPEAK